MQRSYTAYALIGPALLFYLAFVGFPILQVIAYSLFSWDSGTITASAARTNYVRLFSDPVFWIALGHNVIWVILTLTSRLRSDCFLAAVLAESGPNTRRIFSAIYFLPRTIPLVVSGVIWGWNYNPIFGLLNWSLKGIGLQPICRGLARRAGQRTLVAQRRRGVDLLRILRRHLPVGDAVDRSRHCTRRRRSTGPRWWQRFRLITVPMLKSTTLFLGLYAAIEAMRFFDLMWVTTSGGPGYSTEILTTQIYKSFFLIGDFGYASALSVVLLLSSCRSARRFLAAERAMSERPRRILHASCSCMFALYALTPIYLVMLASFRDEGGPVRGALVAAVAARFLALPHHLVGQWVRPFLPEQRDHEWRRR